MQDPVIVGVPADYRDNHQKPVDLQPDSEHARIRMIATEMVRQAIEQQRFFKQPLPVINEAEEPSMGKLRHSRSSRVAAIRWFSGCRETPPQSIDGMARTLAGSSKRIARNTE
jgi:hypothetical protein